MVHEHIANVRKPTCRRPDSSLFVVAVARTVAVVAAVRLVERDQWCSAQLQGQRRPPTPHAGHLFQKPTRFPGLHVAGYIQTLRRELAILISAIHGSPRTYLWMVHDNRVAREMVPLGVAIFGVGYRDGSQGWHGPWRAWRGHHEAPGPAGRWFDHRTLEPRARYPGWEGTACTQKSRWLGNRWLPQTTGAGCAGSQVLF